MKDQLLFRMLVPYTWHDETFSMILSSSDKSFRNTQFSQFMDLISSDSENASFGADDGQESRTGVGKREKLESEKNQFIQIQSFSFAVLQIF
ncbi:hypothetical protein NPIL_45911 [Nephila pilipes]|uniref:Uncharacterized protein n=1 Tax=Nephila pilipes TaxID=299642 RepID=A0A8X6MEB0_NEPPI|nr:hypothetical protein NPIL_45911 [Nephila pilipes]